MAPRSLSDVKQQVSPPMWATGVVLIITTIVSNLANILGELAKYEAVRNGCSEVAKQALSLLAH